MQNNNPIIKAECLYAAECLAPNQKAEIEKFTKKGRKILREILGPKNNQGERKISNYKELYLESEKLPNTNRKRRIAF